MCCIDAQLPSPTSSLLAAAQNKNGSLGDSDAMGMQDSWSDSVLDIVTMLGEGVSGVVEVVWDKWMGCWFTSKMIITHEGLLKQLVHKLVFLSGLRHTNLPSFGDDKKHGGAIVAPKHIMGKEYTICVDVWSSGLEDEDGLETCD
ncbi:hypothetical protein F5148DRAFT_1151570 [Russula earlei]|uniref:Uncharacterized protein n=1 Tax=Russula earlei TaxID=71964 RepID=A0ACC0TZW4_9AGAM|nr:hypothetical protein F5148DRAFT_1151570 [Russula earlei]